MGIRSADAGCSRLTTADYYLAHVNTRSLAIGPGRTRPRHPGAVGAGIPARLSHTPADIARARFDPDLLDVSGANLEVYNLLHSTTPFRVKVRLQALAVLPMLKWEFWQLQYPALMRDSCYLARPPKIGASP